MHRLRKWIFARTKSIPSHPDNLNLSTRSLPESNKWILSEFVLHKLVPIVDVRPYPLDELLLMCSTLAYFKPDIVLEWGTHFGISARIFCEAAKYLQLGTKIHSIDLPPDSEHVENIHEASQRGKFVRGLPVTLHLGDGLTVARQILQTKEHRLPLFFVDGDHGFDSVRNELNDIKEMARRAVILAHDTFFQGAESGYNCGPFDAMSEFTKRHQLPLQSTILGLPGMSVTYWL
jgi:predicted O-methyltransferase YrrM